MTRGSRPTTGGRTLSYESPDWIARRGSMARGDRQGLQTALRVRRGVACRPELDPGPTGETGALGGPDGAARRKESLDSGAWQQVAAQSGCVTTFSTRTNSAWKWHSACASLHSESNGETAFNGSESYRTKVTTTSTMAGKTRTTTRIVQGKWIGAARGDIKPLTPPPSGRGR